MLRVVGFTSPSFWLAFSADPSVVMQLEISSSRGKSFMEMDAVTTSHRSWAPQAGGLQLSRETVFWAVHSPLVHEWVLLHSARTVRHLFEVSRDFTE